MKIKSEATPFLLLHRLLLLRLDDLRQAHLSVFGLFGFHLQGLGRNHVLGVAVSGRIHRQLHEAFPQDVQLCRYPPE